MTQIFLYLPSVYYYATRYSSVHRRIFHLLKYWGSYPLLLLLLGQGDVFPGTGWIWLLSWIGFINLYDIFCYLNDFRASKKEKHPTRRNEVLIASPRCWMILKTSLSVLLIGCIWLVNYSSACILVAALYSLLFLVFTLHNALPSRLRFVTLYVLYLLKASLFLIPGYFAVPEMLQWYVIYAVLFNFSYIPSYFVKKTVKTQPLGGWKRFFLTPIAIKTLLLCVLTVLFAPFGWLLGYTLLCTACEWGCSKYR